MVMQVRPTERREARTPRCHTIRKVGLDPCRPEAPREIEGDGAGLPTATPNGRNNFDGYFIAGGTGVTPFIAILRQLHHLRATKGCTLLLTNRTVDDVILDQELTRILGERHFLKVFTRQGVIGFKERRIDRDLLVTLVQDFDQKFYVCGPADFVKDINALLLELGASAQSLVFEQ